MADTAKRLAGPILLTTATATYYTVPVATTTIVRNIHVANVTASVVTFNLAIGSASTTSQVLFYQMSVPPYGAIDWSGFLVLNAAETLQALSNTATAVNVIVSGVEVA